MSNRTIRHSSFLAFTVSLTASALLFCSAARGEITIDEYTAGSTIARFTVGTSNQITLSGDILGGQRNDSLTLRDLGGQQFFGILGFNGNAQVGQGINDQIYGSMVYSNFADIDITESGNNFAFDIGLQGVTSPNAVSDIFSITVNDGTNSSTVDFDLPGSAEAADGIRVRFDEFSGVDLTSLNSIELAFDFLGAPGQDVSISGFYAVPEPGQAALLFLAATAWLGHRRRS